MPHPFKPSAPNSIIDNERGRARHLIIPIAGDFAVQPMLPEASQLDGTAKLNRNPILARQRALASIDKLEAFMRYRRLRTTLRLTGGTLNRYAELSMLKETYLAIIVPGNANQLTPHWEHVGFRHDCGQIIFPDTVHDICLSRSPGGSHRP